MFEIRDLDFINALADKTHQTRMLNTLIRFKEALATRPKKELVEVLDVLIGLEQKDLEKTQSVIDKWREVSR